MPIPSYTCNKMKKTEAAGGVVRNQNGEIARVQNGRGVWWGFPKGHMDQGEDALTAAKREIAEEAGLSILTYIKDLGTYQRYKGGPNGTDDPSELKTIHMFLFSTTEHRLESRDPQNPQARWVPAQEVEAMLTHPKDREFWLGVAQQVTAPR